MVFSTAPGRVAVDGPAGENSPFAAAFLRQLAEQTVDLQVLPAKLRRDLLIATEGRQVLWDQSTYDQPFLLSHSGNRPLADTPSRKPSSGLVELGNAYAFAREKGLLLPPGLVAIRPAEDSPARQKIGSFKTITKVNLGQHPTGSASLEPLVLIVVSVSGGTAEIIFSTRDWWSPALGGVGGNIWRYSTATLSGARLSYSFGRPGQPGEAPQEFKWNDANSGVHSNRPNGFGWYYSPFTRLDG